MSEPHDHSHPDHDHDHGPGHSHGPGDTHDHGPGGHTHDHGPGKPPAPPTSPEVLIPDDPGSQALNEALRSSFAIVQVIMVALVAVFIISGMVQVAPQNVAVVLTFGKAPDGDGKWLPPGLHWAFPYPINEVVQIPVGQIQTVMSTAGWYATTEKEELTNTEPGPSDSLNPTTDGYTLTADGNIMHVRARLRYRVVNPVQYAFKLVQATNLVENALNNAILYASARYTVDNALRYDRQGFKEKVQNRVTTLIEDQQLGINVEQVEVTAIAPRQVKEAFDAVYGAELDQSKTINAAQGYTNKILAQVKGEADAIINTGKSDSTRMLAVLESDANSFTSQRPGYLRYPDLFHSRLLTETMLHIATNGQDKWFLPDRADGKPHELRLLLNAEPKAPKVKEPGQP